jgi:tetratricopeptide (TPR) repeat protein
MSLMGFGMAAEQLGDYTEARARFEEGLRLYRKIGDRYRVNMALSELAHLERRQGRYEHALPLYYVTLLAWQDLGHRAAVAHQLECFAFIAAAQRNFLRSARLLGAAEALREEIEISMTPLERSEYDLVLKAMRAGMEEDSFMQIWTEGRAMRLGDAVAYALELANAGNLAE